MNDFAIKHQKVLNSYKEKWLLLDIQPKPLDKNEVERYIKKMYRICEISKQPPVVWCNSPMSLLICLNILKAANKKKKENVRYPLAEAINFFSLDEYWKKVLPETLFSSLLNITFFNPVFSKLPSFSTPLWKNYYKILFNVIDKNNVMINNKDEIDRLFPKETIESQIWDFLLRSSGNLMSKPIRESGFGPKKISLVSELDFFRFGLKMIEETSQAHPLIELNSMGCWVLPYKQICFVSGPPTVININANGQLHNPNGYAVEYLDGWGFYACNGITGSTKDAVLAKLK